MTIENFDPTILNTFNFDIQKITNYYLEKLGFEGVVVYNDKANVYFDYHSHPSDEYLFILEGSMAVNENNQLIELKKGDFYLFKSNIVHDARIGSNGAKYIVGSPNGDFSTNFVNKLSTFN